MPWKCQACQTTLRQSSEEERPVKGLTYRCHVCRLELMLNPVNDRLEVTPLPDEPSPARSILTSSSNPAKSKTTRRGQ
jgi:hypothetical protein